LKNLTVLVSGGRSSAMMARHIQTSEKYAEYNKVYCFCNTGQERPETIKFLQEIVKHWGIKLWLLEGVYSKKMGVGVRHKVIDRFEDLDMDSKVFEEAIMHLNKNKWTGVPNPATPYCSEYLKTRVSHSFVKKYFGTTKYIKALGYRKEDMPKRITLSILETDKKRIAPLLTDFETPRGSDDLDLFFMLQPFQLTIPSEFGNCELCWKKSKNNLIKAIQHGPRSTPWYKKMELQYGNMFFRENLSIDDLVAEAARTPFIKEFEPELDPCVCNF
jgi:hypothetical protein|tara:strand:- start:2624 stop:3442 length:819 start_codon:yes stop_codon:yes gene_type:complete